MTVRRGAPSARRGRSADSPPQSVRTTRTSLTTRGAGMLGAGAVTWAVGASTGTDVVVLSGAVLFFAPALSWLSLRVTGLGRRGGSLLLSRSATPSPTEAGSPIAITATIHPRTATARTSQRVHSLILAAPVPDFQREGVPLRAQIRASFARIELSYEIYPIRRGRWPLGPLLAAYTDPLGLARAQGVLNDDVEVAVWPLTVPVTTPHTSGAAGLAPTRSGAADPSEEDSSLRAYQPGDDLRRVHWASAARHSQLMVRSGEGASISPACVLVDLPPLPSALAAQANGAHTPEGAVTEWTITVASSMALHLLEAGHATRLISTASASDQAGLSLHGASPTWVRPREHEARSLVLNQLIDLAVPIASEGARDARAQVLAAASQHGRRSELVVVVLAGPQGLADDDPAESVDNVVADLRSLASGGGRRYVLLTGPALPGAPEPHHRDDPAATFASALSAEGWHVHAAPPDTDLRSLWHDMAGSTR